MSFERAERRPYDIVKTLNEATALSYGSSVIFPAGFFFTYTAAILRTCVTTEWRPLSR